MLPLFVAGAAAVYGTAKGVEASLNFDSANKINEQARYLAESAESQYKSTREDTVKDLKNLGETKIQIYSGSMTKFADTYSKIQNVEMKDNDWFQEIVKFSRNMKNLSPDNIQEAVLGKFFGSTMTQVFLSPGTGLAGFAVMSLMGFTQSSEAKKALYQAKENLDKARVYEQKLKNGCSVMNGIRARANQIQDLLVRLDEEKFKPAISEMSNIIENYGTNWENYSYDEKIKIGEAINLAKTIKIVMDTSLLKEDGTLNDYETKQALEKGQAALG